MPLPLQGSRVDRYGRGAAGWIAAVFDAAAGSNRRSCALLVLLCLALFLPGFFSIPPVDRDEARFAQASKQMVESGDLVDIRLGDATRYKKPIGIYWLQSAVVASAQALGVPDATRTIWLYRLPSLAGAIGAVLLTFWAAIPFVGRRGALFAAILLATCAALNVEARLAKTDAVLLASVVAAMGALARAYLAAPRSTDDPAAAPPNIRLAAIFWLAMAAGILVKGPITPLYVGLAILALGIADRSLRFMRTLAPVRGALACLLIVSPWFVLILLRAGDQFLSESVGHDMLGKVAGGQEGHGAPPGSYLLAFWGTFWPGAPLAALAAPIVWRARRLRPVRFLLAWVVPGWLLFELVPTKLPHYVLPTYPAIAILIALATERSAMALANAKLARLLWLWPVVGAIIAVLALLALAVLDGTTDLLAWPLLIAGFFALVVAAVFVRDYGIEKAALLAVAGMVVSGFGVMQMILPKMESVWISPRLVALAEHEACPGSPAVPQIVSAGYIEPSLMFLMPGRVRFTDGSGAADFLAEGGCRAAFVDARGEARFVRRAETLGLRIERGGDVTGFNYNGGRRVRITLYRNAVQDVP
ncbi:MAG TPA: glycosyltransferase family 39 protein [Xanthobacteraceae bacterium]|nr:glycosyltransferase family 39 protein [Xanthobacteraceae bacterium]